jgi:exonuclease SbcD
MPLKLLATADIHLGRRPGRLPGVLTEQVPVRDLGPAAAWRRLVDLALEEKIHALLLAGDVLEGESDFFEGYRELKAGIEELTGAGVRTIAVAGNHDTRVFPQLADELDGFELLGRGGEWGAVEISAGGETVTVRGWSFPRPTIPSSPLAGFPFERGPGLNLGLLHCDLNQTESVYAPVPTRALEQAGLDGWLLGHVHKPGELTAPRPVGYLGSLTGLDPGEVGVRGPWRLSVEGGQVREVVHIPLGSLRWLAEPVDLTGIDEPAEARSRLLDRIREIQAGIGSEEHPPLAVGVRLTFTGRTRFRREVADLFGREDLGEIRVEEGQVHYFVEEIRLDTLPEVDLEELAGQHDPVGLLAERLLLLERPPDDPDRQRLIARAREALQREARGSHWDPAAPGGPGLPDLQETAERLRRAGREALDGLLAQREAG